MWFVLYNNDFPVTNIGVSGNLPLHFFLERYEVPYNQEMREFIDALINNTVMPVDGEDGLLSIAIGLVATKSVIENWLVKISKILH